MKILFIGTVRFSETMLRILVEERAEICGVVTGRSGLLNADFVDLSPMCREANIKFIRTDAINSQATIGWIRKQTPDLGFCLGWSRLLGSEILRIPQQGMIGYHPAALPANRGRHPIIWALSLGLRETGSTFFWMDEGADTGDIASQIKISIKTADDAGSLYSKIERTASSQIRELLRAAHCNAIPRIPQHGPTNTWRKRSEEDGHIDWRMSTTSIFNLVRALTRPYPGATFSSKSEKSILWKCRIVEEYYPPNVEPGRVVEGGPRPIIKCGDGAVQLLSFHPFCEFSSGEVL